MQQPDPLFFHHDWTLFAVCQERWFVFPRKPSSMLTADIDFAYALLRLLLELYRITTRLGVEDWG